MSQIKSLDYIFTAVKTISSKPAGAKTPILTHPIAFNIAPMSIYLAI